MRHSKILAWLLDHRIEKGTHAQGNLGFRLFLEELGELMAENDVARVRTYAGQRDYWVYREVSGDESRVDIEIAARGKFVIHVESKVYSWEGEDQTDREWRDLQARCRQLGVADADCHAIFLTLDGCKPKNQNFRPVAWSRIAMILDRFADSAEPSEVRLFTRHYSKAIRKLSRVEHGEVGPQDVDV